MMSSLAGEGGSQPSVRWPRLVPALVKHRKSGGVVGGGWKKTNLGDGGVHHAICRPTHRAHHQLPLLVVVVPALHHPCDLIIIIRVTNVTIVAHVTHMLPFSGGKIKAGNPPWDSHSSWDSPGGLALGPPGQHRSGAACKIVS